MSLLLAAEIQKRVSHSLATLCATAHRSATPAERTDSIQNGQFVILPTPAEPSLIFPPRSALTTSVNELSTDLYRPREPSTPFLSIS